jgi:predicted glycoside hydrolase/deacetylase ChbG (UPF0249 family)
MNPRLIVTADDYGLCEPVNQAIEECLSAGTVRATCVMANMPAYRAAALLRKNFPLSSLGIHWNVTQGRPVLPSTQIPTLVNGDGSFLTPSELRRRWWSGGVKLTELHTELRAQFDRLVEIMGPLDFWNTHQNSHVFPGLFQAFVNFGRELEIPAMRSHRRLTTPRGASELSYYFSHPQYWIKGKVISWWSSRAERLGTAMPDARVYAPGYREPDAMIKDVAGRLRWNKVKTAAEIIIHPATAIDKDLFGGLTESRLLEYHAFKNPRLAEDLRGRGVELVGFETLRAHSGRTEQSHLTAKNA